MVGTRINKYLLDNGIKQSFVAEKVGISPAKMSAICRGERSLDCVLYYEICKVLGVSYESFFEEADD